MKGQIGCPTVNAGRDDTVCTGTRNVSLDGSLISSSSETGVLWRTSGTGRFQDSTDQDPIYLPSPADIAAGRVVLTLTVDLETWVGVLACSPPHSDQVTITFSQPPTIIMTPEPPVCASEGRVVVDARSTGTLFGSWSASPLVSGNRVDGDLGNPSNDIDALQYTFGDNDVVNGGLYLVWTSAGPCPAKDSVRITINSSGSGTPPVADAGDDFTSCSTSVRLDATTTTNPQNFPFAWSIVSGSATITPASATTLTPIIVRASTYTGNVTARLTITPTCGLSVVDDVVINFQNKSSLVANAGVNRTTCDPSTGLSGIESTIEIPQTDITWRQLPGRTLVIIDPNRDQLSPIVDRPAAPFTNPVEYELTLSPRGDDGSCASTDVVGITYLNPPVITNLAETVTACGTIVSLNPTVSNTTPQTIYSWTIEAAGGGGELSSNNTKETIFTRGNGNSEPRLRFSVTNPGCDPVSQIVTILPGVAPVVSLAAPEVTCSTAVVVTGTATGASPTTTFTPSARDINGTIYRTGFTGEYEASPTNPSVYTGRTTFTKPTPTFEGPIWITVTANDGGCSSNNEILVTFSRPPSVDLGPDITSCTTSVQLRPVSSAGPSNTVYAWSVSSAAGTFSPDDEIITRFERANNFSGPAVVTLSVTADGDGCTPDSDSKTINFIDTVVPEIDAPASVCGNTVSLRSRVTYPAGYKYFWSINIDAGEFSDDSLPNPTFTILPDISGPVIFTLSIIPPPGSSCTRSSDTHTVTFTSGGTVEVGENSDMCGTIVTLAPTISGAEGATANWTVNNAAAGSFVDRTSPSTQFIRNPSFTGAAILTLQLTPVAPSTCIIAPDSRTITFGPQTVIPNAGAPITTCNNIVQLSGSHSPNPRAIVNWYALDGGTISNSTRLTTSFNLPVLNPAAVYRVQMVVATPGAACYEEVSDTVTITRQALPVITNLPDDTTTCGTSLVLSPNIVPSNAASVYSWTRRATTSTLPIVGVFVPGSGIARQITYNSNGNFNPATLIFTADNGGQGCVAKDSIAVSFTSGSTIDARLGRDTITCLPTIKLDGSTSIGSENALINWMVVNGGRVNPPSGNMNPEFIAPTTNPAGNYQVILTLTPTTGVDACSKEDSDTINITVNNRPTVALTEVPETCSTQVAIRPALANTSSATAFLWTSRPTIGTGATTGTFTSTTASDVTYTRGSSTSPVTLRLVATNTGSGCSAADSIDLRFGIGTPAVANAGTDPAPTCNASVQLNGSASTGATGAAITWQIENGPALPALTGQLSPIFTRPAGPQTVFNLILTITPTGDCSAPDTDIVTVTFLDGTPAVANAGTDPAATCASSVQLNGSASTGATGAEITWRIENGALLPALTGQLSPTFTRPATGGPSYNLILTITPAGTCSAPDTDTVRITFLDGTPVVANAGTDPAATCDPSVQLNGSASTGATGAAVTWQIENGPALPALTGQLSPIFTRPSGPQTVFNLILTITPTGDCSAPDTDIVTVTFLDGTPAVANAGTDPVPTCAPSVQLNGSASTGATGAAVTWQIENGAALPALTGQLNPTFIRPAGPQTVFNLILTITPTGTCSAPASDTVRVTFLDGTPAVANAGADPAATCSNTVQLNGSASTGYAGAGITWQIENGPALPALTGQLSPIFTRPAGPQTVFNLILTITPTGDCSAPDTDIVTVTFLDGTPAVANAGTDPAPTCASSVQLNGSASTGATGAAITWQIENGPALPALTGQLSPIFTRPAGPQTVFNLILTITPTGDCSAPDTDIVTVTFLDGTPAVANAGTDPASTCAPSVQLNGSASTGATGAAITWQIENGPALPALTGQLSPIFTRPATGGPSYNLILTITPTGDCSAPDTDIVTVTFLDGTSAVANAGNDTLVSCGSTVVLNGTRSQPGAGSEFRWTVIGYTTLPLLPSPLTPTFNRPNATQSVYRVALEIIPTVVGACSAIAKDTVTVTFTNNVAPNANAVTSVLAGCASSVALDGSTSVYSPGHTIAWTFNGSSSSFIIDRDNPLRPIFNKPFVASNSYDVVLRITDPSNCFPASEEVIKVSFQPISVQAHTSPTISTCSNIVTPNATVTNATQQTTYKWSSTSATGNFTLNPADPLRPTYNRGASLEPVTLSLEASTPGCTPVSGSVSVTFTGGAVVSLDLPSSSCSTSIQLASNVTGETAGAQYKWSAVLKGTSTLLQGFSPNDTNLEPVFVGAIPGTTVTFTLDITVPTCPGISSASADVVFLSTPKVTLPATYSTCSGTVNATSVVDGVNAQTIYEWRSIITGTSTPATGSFITPANLKDVQYNIGQVDKDVTLILTARNPGCGEIGSDSARIIISSPVVVTLPQPITSCSNTVPVVAQVTGNTTGASYLWTATDVNGLPAGGTFSPSNNPSTIYERSATGPLPVVLKFTASLPGCTPESATVQVNFNSTASPKANAGDPISTCSTSTVLSGSASILAGGIVSWRALDEGSLDNRTILTPRFTKPTASSLNVFRVELTITPAQGNTCQTASLDTVFVTFSNPITVSAGIDQSTCLGEVTVTASPRPTNAAATYRWTADPATAGSFATGTGPSRTFTRATGFFGSVSLIVEAIPTNGCAIAKDTMVATFRTAPIPIAGTDQTVCATSAVLRGTVTGDSTSLIWSSSAGGRFDPATGVIQTRYTPPAGFTGIATLTLLVPASGGCAEARSTVNITFTTPPTINAGLDRPACGRSVALAGSVIGASGMWSANVNGSFTPMDQPNSVFTLSEAVQPAPTSIVFTYATVATPGCASISDQVVISFSNSATSVSATSNRTQVCSDDPAISVTGLVSGATVTGAWATNGDGTFAPSANPLNRTYTPGPLDIAARTVRLTLTSTNNGSCESASQSINVGITPRGTVNAGLDGTACDNEALLSGTSSSLTGLQWRSAAGTFVNNGTLNPRFNLATPTAAPVAITLALPAIGGCPEVTDVVNITFVPRTISAGADVLSCSTSATLAGSLTVPFAGQWSTTALGSFTDASNPVTSFTPNGTLPMAPISLTFTVPATGYCKAASDIVLVSFNPGTVVDAGMDQSVCSNNLSIQLAGKVSGNATSGAWATDGTGSFSNNKLLNAIYVASAADSAKGVVNLTLTSTTTNGCLNVSDAMKITFTPGVVVNAGSDVSVCKNNTAIKLAATTNRVGTIQWSDGGNGGTFSPAATAPDATYTPNAATLARGSVQLTITNTAGAGCSASDVMTITYTPAPVVNAGVDQIVCKSASVIQLNGAVTSASGTGRWSGNGGTFLRNTDELKATYTPTAAEIAAGSTRLILASTGNGNCLAVSDEVTITFSDSPVSAGADQTICFNDANQISLKATALGAGATGVWSTPGAGKFDPAASALQVTYTPTQQELNAGKITFTFTSTRSDVICPGALADQTIVTIKPAPIVAAGPDYSICIGQSITLQGNAQFAENVSWTTTGTGRFATPNEATSAYTPSVADVAAGKVYLIFAATSAAGATCLPVADSVLLTISNPARVNAGEDKSICANLDVPLSGATIIGGTEMGQWTTGGKGSFRPSGSFPAATTYTPSADDKATGFVYLSLNSTNEGGCLPSKDSIKITFNNTFTVNAGLNKTACTNNPNTRVTGTISGGGAGQWRSLGDGIFVPDNKALITTYQAGPQDLSSGRVVLFLSSEDATSCSNADSMTITYLPGPEVNAGSDKTVCTNNAKVSLSGTATPGIGVIWSVVKGDGRIAPNNTLNPTYTPNLVDIRNGKATLVISSIPTPSSGCLPATDTMVVTFIKPPQINAGPDDNKTCNTAPVLKLRGFVNGAYGASNWTTDGTGTFATGGALTSDYTPSAADRSKPVLNFILSADYSNCSPVRDTTKFALKSSGTVDAGKDFNVCANAFGLSLNGTVTGGPSRGRWKSSGTGVFLPSDSALSVSYVLSKADALNTSLNFTLTSINGCAPVSDNITVAISPNTIADAGADINLCSNVTTVTVEGKVIRQVGGVLWERIGTGVFSTPANALTTTYIPSQADIAAGFAKLILTTEGNTQCGLVTDTMTIKIIKPPVADAGQDIDICKGNFGEVNGAIQFGTGLGLWTSTGTGRFEDSTKLQTTYFPSDKDFTLDVFKMVLTSRGAEQCGISTDTIDVIIRPNQGPGSGKLPDLQACSGQKVFLGRAPEADYIYLWRPNNALSDSTSSSPFVTVVNPHTTDTTIAFTLRISERTTTCISRDTVLLKISKNLSVNAGADTAVCAGVPLVIGSQPLPDVEYHWTPTTELSDTTSSNPIFTAISVPSRRTVAYSLLAASTTVKCAQRDTVLITINLNPIVDAGLDTVICSGASVNIGSAPVAGNTYQWIPVSGLSLPTVSNPQLVMENLNPYDSTAMFLLQAKNNLGCVAEDTILVTVQAKPNPRPTSKDSSLFCGQSFSAGYSVLGSPDATYQWKATGGIIDQGQGTSSIVIQWDNTATKSLSVTETISTGCSGNTVIPLNLDTLVIPITMVTKKDNGNINYVTWKFNTVSSLPKTIILKKTLPSGASQSILINNVSLRDTMYVDTVGIDPTLAYDYSISFLGKCGNEKSGLPHNNIVLAYDKNSSGSTIPLSWNAYKNWAGGVGTYQLWSKINEAEYELVDPVDPVTLSYDYNDNSAAYLRCFKIRAVEGNNSSAYSWSNEVCINNEYIVPNAISPNGDGSNDTWIIDSKMFPDNELTIYNQWNSEVYSKKGYSKEWDGEGLPDGTYYYTLKSKNKSIKGYILLMR